MGLRAKPYVHKVGDIKEKKFKGVEKNIVKQTISVEDYKRVLFEGSIVHRKMIRFQSDHHQIYTKDVNKVALSGNYDKKGY